MTIVRPKRFEGDHARERRLARSRIAARKRRDKRDAENQIYQCIRMLTTMPATADSWLLGDLRDADNDP